MTSLSGKQILITGAASGIGRALAERAASEGAALTLVDVDAAALEAVASATGASAHAMSVADPEAWQALPAPEGATGWDFVALNAGVMSAPPDAGPEAADVATLERERYRRILGVNVDGVFFGLQKTLPALAPGGAIVATASVAGLVGYPLDAVYSLTKHAVVGLVRAAALRLAADPRAPRLCAICPGGVATAIVPDYAKAIPMMPPAQIADEIVDLWLHGENGEIRAKIQPDVPAERVPEPKLAGWG